MNIDIKQQAVRRSFSGGPIAFIRVFLCVFGPLGLRVGFESRFEFTGA
ncbi:MAG: hypothetical protein IJ822_08405 [Pyramidobacter sp.]|nr:hypothetical protein [Pyramidobacter sp.]